MFVSYLHNIHTTFAKYKVSILLGNYFQLESIYYILDIRKEAAATLVIITSHSAPKYITTIDYFHGIKAVDYIWIFTR